MYESPIKSQIHKIIKLIILNQTQFTFFPIKQIKYELKTLI
jgi:hypothetical protein